MPADRTVIAQWNDEESVRKAFAANPGEISAIICEPLMCNSGCIAPQPGFLEFLRDITEEERALLIFDEVITGFRLGIAGAQGFYGVTPDLATYAKAWAPEHRLKRAAGKLELMQLIERGDVVHAGTLNGNPLVLSAARAALTTLMRDADSTYRELFRRGERLREEWRRCFGRRTTNCMWQEKGQFFISRSPSASPQLSRSAGELTGRSTATSRSRCLTKEYWLAGRPLVPVDWRRRMRTSSGRWKPWRAHGQTSVRRALAADRQRSRSRLHAGLDQRGLHGGACRGTFSEERPIDFVHCVEVFRLARKTLHLTMFLSESRRSHEHTLNVFECQLRL